MARGDDPHRPEMDVMYRLHNHPANKIMALTPEMERFIEWLCIGSEREEGETQKDFAEKIGVHTSTLTKWKKHPVFRAEWDKRMRETHAAPDLLQDQLKVLRDVMDDPDARSGDRIKAVETYWKLLGQNSPDRLEVDDKRGAEDMSDEELAEALDQARSHLSAN